MMFNVIYNYEKKLYNDISKINYRFMSKNEYVKNFYAHCIFILKNAGMYFRNFNHLRKLSKKKFHIL